MAPRHRDMTGRNSIHQDSSTALEDDPFATEDAFDPFDTTNDFSDDFDDSFANDFDDVEFPEPVAEAPGSKPSSKPKRSSKSRTERRERERMEESSSRRMGDSTSRLGDSSSRLDDSSKLVNGSRQRTRMRDRTPKPTSAPSFPRNTSRRGSKATSSRSSSSGGDPLSGRSSQHNSKRAPPSSPRTGARPSAPRSRSRRALLQETSEAPLSPSGGEDRRSSGTARLNNSPRTPTRSSKRDSISTSDARSRIRKEAALQRQRELREQEEAKLAEQKAKLARQKQKTNELLGRKLAKLDAMNGDTSNNGDHGGGETRSLASSKGTRERRAKNDLNASSMHSANTARGAVDQRRRRRTQLSHNILVRNMNQMTALNKQQGGGSSSEFFDHEHDETDHDLDEITEETEEMSMLSSSQDHNNRLANGKKEAWQRRRERQIRNEAINHC